MNKEDLILEELRNINVRLDTMQTDITKLQKGQEELRGAVDELREGQEEIRASVNRLVEWADECGYIVQFPLPKL